MFKMDKPVLSFYLLLPNNYECNEYEQLNAVLYNKFQLGTNNYVTVVLEIFITVSLMVFLSNVYEVLRSYAKVNFPPLNRKVSL